MIATQPVTLKREKKIPELDGVRGIAILMVLVFHFGARPPLVPRLFTAPFAFCWVGVDLFFVLSGFLITGILLDTRRATNYFSSFYARRILRIFPIYYLLLAGIFFVVLPIAHRHGYFLAQNDSLEAWYWAYLSNWQSAWSHENRLLTHVWSLAIEEQFYIFWPLLVFVIPRSKLPYLCIGLIAGCLGLRIAYRGLLPDYEFLLYELTPFRLDTLATGALVAWMVRDEFWRGKLKQWLRPASWLFAILLVGVFAVARDHLFSSPWIATLGFTFIGALSACLIFFGFEKTNTDQRFAKVLRSPTLVAFGKYSYAIYVVHFPIAYSQNAWVLRVASGMPRIEQIAMWAGSKIFGVAITFVLALISWNLIEKHFLRLKTRFAARYELA